MAEPLVQLPVAATRAAIRDWSAEARRMGETIALVPTMGSLHAGHASLIDLARARADRVAVSVFVNPLQFGPGEDLERYPRDLEGDVEIARRHGADLVFAPSAGEMYPAGEPWVRVVARQGADLLCGRSRPGHFEGVLTVVAKLFGLVRPDVAVFGQKDYQQLVLIRRMVADLEMGIEVLAGPIVREPDGLAMSSRNRYLDGSAREQALRLSAALGACEALFEAGERDAERFRERMHRAGGSGVTVEYGEVVDPATLQPVREVQRGTVCAIAARVGQTRLIDNHILGTGQLT